MGKDCELKFTIRKIFDQSPIHHKKRKNIIQRHYGNPITHKVITMESFIEYINLILLIYIAYFKKIL